MLTDYGAYARRIERQSRGVLGSHPPDRACVDGFFCLVGGATSDSTQRPMIFGYTVDGRYITVIYEQIDVDTVYPVTAIEVPEPA